MKQKLYLLLLALLLATNPCSAKDTSLEDEALSKIKQLEKLVSKADRKEIDHTRENSTLWMARKFLDYARWDEKNVDDNIYQYSMFRGYKTKATEMAKTLPDYERKEVIAMLDTSIKELQKAINKEVTRRDVPSIDWTNITPQGASLVSNGQPVFINDYFTKTPELVNDYCGRVKSTSLSLGAIKNPQGELSPMGINKITNAPDKYSGYVLLWHSAAPKWATELYGDMSKGRRYFTHYDIDNPNIRSLWSRTFETTVPILKDKKISDMGYVLSNEPHWFSVNNSWFKGEISDYTVAKFKDWLKSKHGTIENLNTLWGSNFADFESVQFTIPFPAKLIGTNACYDWQRFNMDRVTDWFTFLDSGIRKYDKDAHTHIKYMPHLFTDDHRDHGLDFEALVELTTISGNDAKITKKQLNKLNEKEYWEGRYSYDWREVAMSYDFFKSVAPNKANINSEGHFLSASHYRDQYMTTDYVNSTYWLATLHGMNGCYTWFWAREGDGIRRDLMKSWGSDVAMNAAYAATVCTQPRVANQLSQTMMELRAFGNEVTSMQSLRKPLRIFYSETSALKKHNHMTKLFGLYESLYFEGMPLGFATEKIIRKQDNSSWDIILITETEYVTDTEFNALRSYIQGGGTVVMDSKSLAFDEYGRKRTSKLSSTANGKVIVVGDLKQVTNKALELSSAKNLRPNIVITEHNESSHKGCMWRVTPYDGGGYMVTIINLGNTTAEVTLSNTNKAITSVTDLYTGLATKTTQTLTPEKVLLLHVK